MKEYQVEYKGYYVKPHQDYPSSYIVVTTGRGGKIPSVLDGMFTSRSIAKEEIDRYMAGKPEKENDTNETVKTSRSK